MLLASAKTDDGRIITFPTSAVGLVGKIILTLAWIASFSVVKRFGITSLYQKLSGCYTI